MRRLPILAALLMAFLPAQADITGTVTLVGKPNSQDETFVAQASGCGESPVRHTENWKIGPKSELGDVVVWIVDPNILDVVNHPPSPAPVIELKQIGCRYVPHVIAVQAGSISRSSTAIRRSTMSTPRSTTVRSSPPGADVPGFNIAQFQGQTDEREFDDPGIYTLQCDVHSWMQCWVMVLKSNVFGVTDLGGKFKLQLGGELEDGDYKIDAWHPRFAQTLEQTIHVKNGMANVAFQFDGTKSF